MSELGQFLREKRVEKKISIERLQELTKIRKRYIQAIENGEHQVLPGQFYARAFIKSYAEAIGLNAEEVLERYRNELPSIPKRPAVESPPPSRKKKVHTRSFKLGKWVSRVVFYAFLLVIAFFIYLAVVNYGNNGDQTLEPNPEQGAIGDGDLTDPDPEQNTDNEDLSDPAPEQPEEPEIEEEPLEPEWTYVQTSGSTSTYEYKYAERMEIRIEAQGGDVWLSLRDVTTNQVIEEPYINVGQEQTWDLTEYQEVTFHFGNPKAVRMFINDEAVSIEDIPDLTRPHHIIISFQPLEQEE